MLTLCRTLKGTTRANQLMAGCKTPASSAKVPLVEGSVGWDWSDCKLVNEVVCWAGTSPCVQACDVTSTIEQSHDMCFATSGHLKHSDPVLDWIYSVERGACKGCGSKKCATLRVSPRLVNLIMIRVIAGFANAHTPMPEGGGRSFKTELSSTFKPI